MYMTEILEGFSVRLEQPVYAAVWLESAIMPSMSELFDAVRIIAGQTGKL